MIKKEKVIVTGIVMMIIIITSYWSPLFIKLNITNYKSEEKYTDEEKVLYYFIEEKLMDKEGGIYTNYLNEDNNGDITKGYSVLSESQGLLLEYYLYCNDKDGFRRTFKYIREKMILNDNLVSWRINSDEKSEVSATIDDLRIVRNLLVGSEEFKDLKYKYYGWKISKGIYNNLVVNHKLMDFKDQYGSSNLTTLCYLDLKSLDMLRKLDKKWDVVFSSSIKIINEGYIDDNLPLYKKYYDNNKNDYDEEDIDTLLSLIVILNKAEIGEDISPSIRWIKNQFKEYGYISTKYTLNNNEGSDIESTAIYGLIAQISKKINDEELYKLAIDRMNLFQVKDLKSDIYGAFGDDKSKVVFSYDNLNALLAYRRRWEI